MSEEAARAQEKAEGDEEEGPVFQRGQALGRYIVLDELGVGGQGVVLAAYDPELDRKVALKLLKPGKRGSGSNPSDGQVRLLREAQAMARLSHPNVIAVHDVGTLDDQVFVAMELVDGGTLRGWLKEPRTWREVLGVFLQAGRGLAAAHAAGLVHRDFKPDNVLLSKDGRARVTDFGLARLVRGDGPITAQAVAAAAAGSVKSTGGSGEHSVSALSTSLATGALNANLTQQGVVVGTLNYMPPEQFRGETPDARSDQFSFCAALYRALWQKRPFDPQELRAAAWGWNDDVTQGVRSPNAPSPVREPPRGGGVPAWLRKAIMRGLSLEPSRRYPTMDALLHVLERKMARARWRWPAAAALLLVAGAGAAAAVRVSERRSLCSGASRQLKGVWDEQVAEQIDAAFRATGVSYAADASRGLKAALDRYAGKWAAVHREACEATRVRGEQSESLMQKRMVCLDGRLKDLGALARVLASADAKVVERAADAAASLPSLSSCSDAEALTSRAAPPDEPQVRARIEALQGRLSEVKALTLAGRYKGALEIAQTVAAEAEKIAYRPLTGEALYHLGWLQDRNGDPGGAEKTLVRSSVAAEEGRDDALRALIGTKLVYVTGSSLMHREPSGVWADLTGAVLRRMGGDPELEAQLALVEGSVALAHRQFPDAKAFYEQALAGFQRVDPNHFQIPLALTNLGRACEGVGDHARAASLMEQSLALAEKVKGKEHPALAFAHYDMGQLYVELEQYDRALEHARRAEEIWAASEGPEHPDVADAYDNIGTVYQKWGKYDLALDAFRKALAIKEKKLGPEHHDVAYSLDGLGQTLLLAGKPAEALPFLERALVLWGDEDSGQGLTGFALARAVWGARHDAAWAKGLAGAARDAYDNIGTVYQK
ncbi:MAG TPA: serine/threonine-protein kinase, partial [Myxococcales bacterium]|nr:serine/threonine-protein kinase [Myxococcales bacterium]